MNIYEDLKKSFNPDEPIFIDDIEKMYPDKSRPWIDKAIKLMVDKNQISRFSTGIYYIPRQTILGPSFLNPQKVIAKKYLKDEDQTVGFFGGLSLLNMFGLTTQVPNTITVITNNESTRGRRIKLGKQDIYLSRPTVEISDSNYILLQFLEMIKLINFDQLDEIELNNIKKYISENGITLKDVSKYCTSYPDSVSKKILGGPLLESLTQW